MATQTRAGDLTFADFLELVREDQKADLIDGVIYMASPENIEHNELVGWLFTVMSQFITRRGLGRVTLNRVAYRLTERTAPEPDIAFIDSQRLSIVKRGYVAGAPDVAVEIVSPDSVDRDYETKRRRYEEADVREYWIIDPDEQRATFLVRGGAVFVEAKLKDHIFESTAIPGFRLDVRWLWQRPLPDSLAIVLNLLGERA